MKSLYEKQCENLLVFTEAKWVFLKLEEYLLLDVELLDAKIDLLSACIA